MLFLLTALDCEARPVIHHFRLQRNQAFKPFPLYENETLKLAVSGVGMDNMSLACATLAGIHSATQFNSGNQVSEAAWLNIGIAGHQSATPGSAFLVHKVSGGSASPDSQGRHFYPVWPGQWPHLTASLMTVDKPELEYAQDALYDMEATAFYRTASRFSTLELIHVLKVISDNPQSSLADINKESVSRLVGNQIELISMIVERLLHTADMLTELAQKPKGFDDLLAHYSVSVSQQVQLGRVLRRLQLLEAGAVLDLLPLAQYKSIKHWMQAANEYLSTLTIRF